MKRLSEHHVLAATFFLMGPVCLAAPKAMTVVLAASALGLLAVRWRGKSGKWGWPVTTGRFAAGFVAVCIVSAVWSVAPERTLKTAFPFGLELFAGLVVVAASFSLEKDKVKTVMRGAVGGVLVSAAVLIFEYLSGNALRVAIFSPAAVTVNDPIVHARVYNVAATVLSMMVIPVVALSWREGARFGSAVLGGVYLAIFVLADADVVRAGLLLGAAVVLAAAAAPRVMTAVASVMLVVGILSAPFVFNSLPPVQEYVKHLPKLSGSIYHRLFIWEDAAHRIRERPLLGHGFDTSRTMSDESKRRMLRVTRDGEKVYESWFEPIPLHPHNAVLQIWLELGAIGALLFAGFMAYLSRCIRRLSRSGIAIGLGTFGVAAFIAFSAYGVWQSWWQATLWLLGALTIVVAGRSCVSPESIPRKDAGASETAIKR